MHIQEIGAKNGPTIVFLHGGGMSGWMWKKQLEYFNDYHCIVLDLPEHGKSSNDGPFSISDCARRIADLIESKAHGKKAHVIGHSLGARILVELLTTRPNVIDHAVIASALFRPMPFMRLMHRPFIFYTLMTWLLWLSKLTNIMSLYLRAFQFPDATYVENARADFPNFTSDRLYRIYDEVYRHLTLPKGLAEVPVPTLVIAGEKESKAMRESFLDIVSIMPNAHAVFIKKADHYYPWSKHDTFNKLIRDFLDGKQLISNTQIELLS